VILFSFPGVLKINNVAPQARTLTLIFTFVIAIFRFNPGTFLRRSLLAIGRVFAGRENPPFLCGRLPIALSRAPPTAM
jgi:hypothetical protein